MKKFLILFLLISFSGYSQIIQTNGGSVDTCSGVFYDSGGVDNGYSMNENSVFTICPDADDVAILADFTYYFTATDVLNIYDGDDTSAPLLVTLTGFIANPDLPSVGATDLNATGCLTFEFISDEVGQTNGWVADISCYVPCQTITGNILSNPEVDEDEIVQINEGESVDFTADFDFVRDSTGITYDWDFGDGTVGVGENINHTYTTAGTYTVTLTITDAQGCIKQISMLVSVSIDIDTGCPEIHAVDSINGTNDFVLNCNYPGNGSVTLTVDYVPIRTNETYRVDPIPYAPLFPVDEQDGLELIESDDEWGEFKPFPDNFNFCYFGNSYDGVVVGDNGVVSFNSEYANLRCPYKLTDGILYDEIPQSDYPSSSTLTFTNALNSVLGAHHDLYFTESSALPESFFGYGFKEQGNCSAFVVNFYKIPMFSCITQYTTQQIVLYEGTGIIDVNILNKPECDFNRNAGVIGLINEDGSIGISPPDRNTSSWSVSEDAPEAWRFTPNGDSEVPVSFEWYNSAGDLVGTEQDLLVESIRAAEVYSVKVTYDLCGENLIIEDVITINYNFDAPEAQATSISLCDSNQDGTETWDLSTKEDEILLNNDIWSINGYFNSLEDALAEDPTLAIPNITEFESGETTIFVLVTNVESGCQEVSTIQLQFNSDVVADPISEEFCAPTDATTLTVDLTQYNDQITGGADQNVAFYLLEDDSINNPDNFIPDPTAVELALGENTFYVRTDASGCLGFTSVVLTLNPSPNSYVFNVPVAYCDALQDGEEVIDLTISEGTITGTQTDIVDFTYYTSLADAESGDISLSIADPSIFFLNGQNADIYVVVNNSFGCSTIITLPVTLDSDLTFDVFSLEACDNDENGLEIWDLTIAADNYQTPNNDYDFEYYESSEDAINQNNPIIDFENYESGNTVVFLRVIDASGCFGIAEVNLVLNDAPEVNNYEINICSNQDNSDVLFDFNSIFQDLTVGNASDFNFDVYLTLEDAENGTNALENYQSYGVSDSTEFYISVTNGAGCRSIVMFMINLQDVPVLNVIDDVNICDLNQDGSEQVDLTVVEDGLSTDLTLSISYYTTENDALNSENQINTPNGHLVNNGTTTVWIRAENSNSCFATTSFDVVLTDGIPLNIVTKSACDSGDGTAVFNIEEILTDISADIDDYTYNIYESETDAENGVNPIVDISAYVSTDTQLYIKVEDINGCDSTQVINLEVTALPELENQNISLCDNDFDSLYDVMLTDYNALILQSGNIADYSFSYYLNSDDANNAANVIDVDNFRSIDALPLTVYVRVEAGDCYNVAELTFDESADVVEVNNNLPDVTSCDDGFVQGTFDFSIIENDITITPNADITYYVSLGDAQNQLNTVESPYTGLPGEVYVRVDAQGYCSAISQFNILLIEPPQASFSYSALQVCQGEDITLSIDDYDESLNYVWTINGVDQAATEQEFVLTSSNGDSNVILTASDSNLGCSSSVEEDFDFVTIPQILSVEVGENSLTVNPMGQSPFEYSLDNINWQTSEEFTDLEPGVYTVYIRSFDLGCEGQPQEVLLLTINNVLTPNGDGINDTFVIPFLDLIKDAEGNTLESSLGIYDRYGKELYYEVSSEDKTEFVWDGRQKGKVLPSGDYWFILNLGDDRQFKGHITVKNK